MVSFPGFPLKGQPARSPVRIEDSRTPIEGWGTVLLHATLLIVMAESISRIDRGERMSMLLPLALGGGIIGFALAKARTLDLLAHLTALIFGVAAAITVTAIHYGDIGGGWRTSLDRVDARVDRFVEAFVENTPLDDDLLVAAIGVTLWLVAYCSAWMLYRRRWLGPSLMLPGVVILVCLGLDRDASAAPIFVYLAVAMTLSARHFAFRRQMQWRRERLAAPVSLGNRFLTSGVVVAVAALAIGITSPVEAPDRFIDQLSSQVNDGWEKIQETWKDLPFNQGNGNAPGTYPEFLDEFEIGAPLDLTEDPVAVLQADEPSYLAVRRYNIYDGHRWLTDVDSTFRFPTDDDDVSATRATFQPSQQVTLSSQVRRDRETSTGLISVLRQKGGLLFTLDTYSSSSEATTVSLSWQQLNDYQIPVNGVDGASVPPDLYALLALLQQAQFTTAQGSAEPVVTDPNLRSEIARIQQTLRADYPLQTRIELEDGQAVLHVTGRVPVYDDIEAVYQNDPERASSQYLVTGLRSTATPDDLRRTSADYPTYVTDRYLALPQSVTERTRELTNAIVSEAGATTVFDQAMAVQEHLRSAYPYDTQTPAPPEDQDFVDHFLFDLQRGRCEHYATAMIVMMRTLGVPARLVNGYNRAEFDPSVNGYLYREKQAHTWVEIYFPGYGWIPFEPTPSEDAFDYGKPETDTTVTPMPTPTPEPALTPTVEPTEPAVEASPSPIAGPITPSDDGASLVDRMLDALPIIPTVIVLGALLAAIGLAMAWLWGLRGLRPGAALYARALRIARFWGVRSDPTQTPVEFATTFSRTVPGSRSAIRAVAEIYSEEQYGPPGAAQGRAGSERAAWRQLRGSLLRWRPWRRGRVLTPGRQEGAGD